jgi:vancomycin resistance protein YoaR
MATDTTTAARRGFPFGKLALAVVAGFVLAVGFGAGALLAYQGQYEDRVYPGVTVDGVDVSGLTREEAVARLEAGLAGYGEGSALVDVDGKKYRITYAAMGRRADVERLVDLAWAVGRSDDDALANALGGVRSYLDGSPIDPLVVVDAEAVAREVAALAGRVDRAPLNAAASRTKSGFVAKPAVPGAALPQAEVAADLLDQLTDATAPATLDLAVARTPVAPQIGDEAAARAIEAAERMAADVEVAVGDERWTIKAATVRGWIRFEAAGDQIRPTIDPAAPTKALEALAEEIDTSARNAGFRVGPRSITGVTPSRNGRAVNVEASAPVVAAAVLARAEAGATAPPAELVVKAVKPRFTTEQAKAAAPKMRMISSWTTYYEVSERNGFAANITIPALDLDGYVVAPGATFDFWRSIGPVTTARGYRAGGAIINGKSEPTGALAGGICSTSTTLFNAVARAGYQMLSRHNHYYYIPRYPTGLDATVAISGGSVTTMSWKNDTDQPVLIRASARPGVVTFSLYTVPVNSRPAIVGGSRVPGATNVTYRVANGRTVVFRTSGKRNYNRATSSVQRTTALPAGRSQVVEYPVDGFSVTVTRQVYEGGALIRSNTWVSNYARVNGLTLVGAR